MDTITLKSSMPNIISNRPFYSDHSTYLWAHINFNDRPQNSAKLIEYKSKEKTKMTDFLDPKIIRETQQIISSNSLFYRDPVQKKNFNFICASLQRISTAVNFLNSHSDLPKENTDFIHWFVYANMLQSTIYCLFKNLNLDYKRAIAGKEKNYFNLTCEKNKLVVDDDGFFNYLRALVFAHPTDTDNRSGQPKKIYSPLAYVDERHKEVGAMIYTSGEEGISLLQVPFALLKDYINNRYQLLNHLIDYLNKVIEEKTEEWKKRKIDINAQPLTVLKELVEVLKERYVDHNEFDELITYFTLKSSISANDEAISKYRKAIVATIPILCDAIVDMDYNRMFDILSQLVGWGGVPDGLYEGASYDLEKIFSLSHQTQPSDIYWALRRVDSFSDNFAKKWVTIDTKCMSFDEIKLLVAVACYCEREELIQKT